MLQTVPGSLLLCVKSCLPVPDTQILVSAMPCHHIRELRWVFSAMKKWSIPRTAAACARVIGHHPKWDVSKAGQPGAMVMWVARRDQPFVHMSGACEGEKEGPYPSLCRRASFSSPQSGRCLLLTHRITFFSSLFQSLPPGATVVNSIYAVTLFFYEIVSWHVFH
jgi:hypothetical protein